MPARTDCAVCFFQRLGEWYRLWLDYPEEWARGEEAERLTGHTFRSAGRDSWPASMEGLRREFEAGRVPTSELQLQMFDSIAESKCRMCSI